MRRVLTTETAPPSTQPWVIRGTVVLLVLVGLVWWFRDPDLVQGPLQGFGTLRILGITRGPQHELPGRPGWVGQLPPRWRNLLAKRMGYGEVTWTSRGPAESLHVWCEWTLTNALPGGGWFEARLLDRNGQTVDVGNFPGVGYTLGRHVEPLLFRPLHPTPDMTLEIRRFQPGSPYRERVANLTLPDF
jgi:hypothetical protein